jgi:hypothetical protein
MSWTINYKGSFLKFLKITLKKIFRFFKKIQKTSMKHTFGGFRSYYKLSKISLRTWQSCVRCM